MWDDLPGDAVICACGDQTEHPIGVCVTCVSSPSPEQAARLTGARLAFREALRLVDVGHRDDWFVDNLHLALCVAVDDCGQEE